MAGRWTGSFDDSSFPEKPSQPFLRSCGRSRSRCAWSCGRNTQSIECGWWSYFSMMSGNDRDATLSSEPESTMHRNGTPLTRVVNTPVAIANMRS